MCSGVFYVFIYKENEIMGWGHGPSKWRTKYQMEGLKDGEHFNLRDGKIYIIKDGKYIKTKRRLNELHKR